MLSDFSLLSFKWRASVERRSEAPSAIFTRIGETGENNGVKRELALSPPTLEWEQKMAEGTALFRPTTDTYITCMRNVVFPESAKTA
jgi:hypothetical protein